VAVRPPPRSGPGMTRRALVPLALAVTLTACGTSGVTTPRVQTAVAGTFTNLYLRQQHLLGHDGITPDWVAGQASCTRRGSPGTQGPGDDWSCQLRWRGWDGTPILATYDVEVRAGGCYTATGPTTVTGGRTIRTATGELATNPLFQFDGCFATG
jgi:hypothetical protein